MRALRFLIPGLFALICAAVGAPALADCPNMIGATDSSGMPANLATYLVSAANHYCNVIEGRIGGSGAPQGVNVDSSGVVQVNVTALPANASTATGQTTSNGYLSTLAATVSSGMVNVNCTGCSGGGGGGAVTAVSSAYALGAIVDLGTGATPGANTTNGYLKAGNTSLSTLAGAVTGGLVQVNCSTGCGGGGGGGAITAASNAYAAGAFATGSAVDGWNLTEGAKADAAWTTGSGSMIAILKTIANAAAGALPTGGNLLGHIITDAGSVTVATGNAADNATDSGNPLKIGCVYLTTLTTYTTTGNRANCEVDHFGNLRTVAGIFKVTGTDGISNFNFGALPVAGSVDAATQAELGVMNLTYNGATANGWDRSRNMLATDDDDGTGVSAVHTKPISGAAAGLSDSHCAVVCASSIVSGAHNLYGAGWSSTVAGWLLLYDATSCAANGTVAPLRAYAYTVANTTSTLSWGDLPHHFATGIAACFSVGSGPFSATASTTAGIWLDYK